MPLDHYVPQVHLKNFYSPEMGKRLYAYSKRTGKFFIPKAADVCRIPDGNTNEYLTEPRAVEAFLKDIEPNYNEAIGKLRDGKLDGDAVYVIAGFVAYVASCAPAAQRLGADILKLQVETVTKVGDRAGLFDDIGPLPPEIGEGTVEELVAAGKLIAKIDAKYPQAIGIDGLMKRISRFGNARWEVFVARAGSSAFFTSDFPTAPEPSAIAGIENRVVPLAPDLAIRIWPDMDFVPENKAVFEKLKLTYVEPAHHQIVALNRTIVRAAEDTVFYRDDEPWVARFVKANAPYGIQSRAREQSLGRRIVIGARMVVARK